MFWIGVFVVVWALVALMLTLGLSHEGAGIAGIVVTWVFCRMRAERRAAHI